MTEETQKSKVHGAVIGLLSEHPTGMRYGELMQAVEQSLPDMPVGTIKNCFQLFIAEGDPELCMPSPGLYTLMSQADTGAALAGNDGLQKRTTAAGTKQKDRIRKAIVEILTEKPQGLRHGELVAAVVDKLGDVQRNTVLGNIHQMVTQGDCQLYKPSPGLYKLRDVNEESVDEAIKQTIDQKDLDESHFYEPFAEWLRDELGECTEAVKFGGGRLGRKWGTPDVIGVSRPSKRSLIQFDPEIITAEIKLEPSEVITAFGQAVAYRLFSNKVYLALPDGISSDDKSRMEALCMLFGIGLVLYNPDPAKPDFQIRVRAQKHDTDMFYTNDFVDRLDKADSRVCGVLFGG